jgi:cysteine sulfinate desulfinase/cysteine desulfurase-like protein
MIYLDYNATTPVLPEVLQAMMSYLASEWGNLSSTYSFSTSMRNRQRNTFYLCFRGPFYLSPHP